MVVLCLKFNVILLPQSTHAGSLQGSYEKKFPAGFLTKYISHYTYWVAPYV